MTVKQSDELSLARLREQWREAGARGGKAKTKAKREAARRNMKKAHRILAKKRKEDKQKANAAA